MKKLLLFATILFAFYATNSAQIGGYAVELYDATATVDDYIDVPDGVYFDDNTFTVEAWVYVKAMYNWSRLIDFGNGAPSNNVLIALQDGTTGFPKFEVYQAGNQQGITSGTALSLNQWVHIACVLNAGTAYMYLNGVQVATGPIHAPNNVTRVNNYIGKSNWGTENPNPKMKIDEFRIWSVARSIEEIRATMFKELAGSETGLQVYYKMSNGSGTTLTDNKTSGTTHATLVNDPIWKTSGCFANPTHAIDFDNAEHIEATLTTAIGNRFTQEVWIYPTDGTADYRGIIGYHPGAGINRTPCIFQHGLNVHWGFGDGTTWYNDETTNNPLTINRWNHIKTTFDGTNYRLYVNGKEERNYTGAAGKTPINTTAFRIGVLDNHYLGKVDEVRIWSDVRTPQEIRENMMRPLRGDEENLKACYRFDEGEGTTVYDLTSNAQNGTMVSMEPATDRVTSTAFNTWIGSESSSWATGANWGLGTPTNGDMNAGVYKWALGNELNINTAALEGLSGVKHFLISAGSNPTLGANISVYGNLLVDANLDLNGKTITLVLGYNPYLFEGSGRIYGATGSIGGPVYIPSASPLKDDKNLGFAITSPVELEVDVFRNHQVYTNSSGSSIARNFTVIAPTPPGSSDFPVSPATPAVIEFKYNELELNGIPEADLLLVRTTNGTDWTSYPDAVIDQVNNKVTLTDNTGTLSLTGTWTLTNSNSPLPVELTSFTAKATGNSVTLNWETKTEVMNLGFEVEMKTATTEWEKIGFVEGHHTSNSPKYYSFTDQPKASGKILYRLKQLDTDGQFEYSSEVSVDLGLPTEFSLSQNYPNPFNPETVIGYALPVTGEVNISIYNAIGEKITTLVDGMKEAGNHQVSFNADNLPSGLYFCRMTAGKFTTTRKMMLMR